MDESTLVKNENTSVDDGSGSGQEKSPHSLAIVRESQADTVTCRESEIRPSECDETVAKTPNMKEGANLSNAAGSKKVGYAQIKQE